MPQSESFKNLERGKLEIHSTHMTVDFPGLVHAFNKK